MMITGLRRKAGQQLGLEERVQKVLGQVAHRRVRERGREPIAGKQPGTCEAPPWGASWPPLDYQTT